MGLAVVEKLSDLEHRRAILGCGSHPLYHPTQCSKYKRDCGGVTTVCLEPRREPVSLLVLILHYIISCTSNKCFTGASLSRS